mgnify:CR=1 FL=1
MQSVLWSMCNGRAQSHHWLAALSLHSEQAGETLDLIP